LGGFEIQWLGVAQVLQVTTAAVIVERTGRLYPQGRCLAQLDDLAKCVTAALFDEANFDLISRCDARHKDGQAIEIADAPSTVRQAFDGDHALRRGWLDWNAGFVYLPAASGHA
jgi:hypothetical protein